jgi:hypothetical protein
MATSSVPTHDSCTKSETSTNARNYDEIAAFDTMSNNGIVKSYS